MQLGAVIEFFDEHSNVCGIIMGIKGKKLEVLIAGDKEKIINVSRVIHIDKASLDLSLPRKTLLHALDERARRRSAIAESIDLQALWETLAGEQEAFDPVLLAELWFGGQAADDQTAAMVRLLFRDKIFFVNKDGRFIPNQAEEVERNLNREKRAEERRRQLEETAAWLQSIADGRPPVKAPENLEGVIELLKEVAVHGNDAPNLKRAKEIFSLMKNADLELPLRILLRLGIWGEHENLLLHRLKINIAFAAEQLQEAERLVQENTEISAASRQGRRDCSGLPLMTIDNVRTKDIDDAIHVEPAAEGWRVGIHIADVAAVIRPETLLDKEALDRGTTIYLPDQKIPMFPPVISEGMLSLIQDKERIAVSILATIQPSGAVSEFEIFPSIVKVKRRLTYEWVNEHLVDDPELNPLFEAAQQLRRQRLACGAIPQYKPEVEIWVEPDFTVHLEVVHDESTSHVLVSEFMILANHLFGRFLQEHDVPALFRSQLPPLEEVQPMAVYDPVQHYRMRKAMSRAEVSTTPAPHTGLGVAIYTTATSPIRRYTDLIIQRQLHAAMSPGQPALNPQELVYLMGRLEPLLQQTGLLEFTRHRYWLFKHLEGRVGQSLNAVILERFPHRVRLAITEIMLELEIPVGPNRDYTAGQRVALVIERVSASNNHIFVRIKD